MKRILLSLLAVLAIDTAYGQVKATSAELNAGIDDAKFATALALQGSKYLDQSGTKLYAVTAAGANTYTANIAPAITAYSAGQVFFIKITTANTGASTLNLNGLGAKILVKDAATALAASDLLANRIYAVAYDGTNFQVVDVADALKANLASPAFTGVPTAPTATAGTNTTQLATTAFVGSALTATGLGVSNLTLGTATATTQPITNSNGTGVTLPVATGSLAGLQSAADKTKLDAITGTNTGDQSLSTTGVAGNISISAGNAIGLTSLQRATTGFEDANSITNTGFYAASTSSSATNYAAGGFSGMGIHVVRNSGDALGSFSFWKPTTGSDALYFRTGIGATGLFSAWDIVAGRNWTQTQINNNFIGNGFDNGNTVVSTTIDANSIIKSNVGYANVSSTNLPTVATTGGILSSAMLTTPVNTFQTYGHIGAEDSYWFRKQISGTWGTWYQVASRNWASSIFSPITGNTNYIQNGITQQLNSNFNISGTGTTGTSITGQLGVGNGVLAATKLYVNTQNDAVIGLRVRANSATQSANLQEWQTSAGTAQTVIDNAGNLGINAGANLYNVIGTEQQTIYNPAHYYSTPSTTGAIVFKHATFSAATMFDIKLKFYRYNTNTALGELRISFYKSDATTINSTSGKYAYTIGNPPVELDQVRVGFDGSGNLSIILSDIATAWGTHNRVVITEMTTSYTGGANSVWRNGWTSAVETDLSAYASLTALPINNMSSTGFIQNSIVGQTADLRITGVGLFGGRVTAGTISNFGQFTTVPASDATKGLVVRGFSPTQSASLFETQTNAGNVTYSINPLGISSQTSTSNNSSTGRTVMAIRHESTFAGTYGGTIPVMVDLGVKTPTSDQITGRISSGFNGDADRTSGYFAINTASSGTLGEAIRFNSDKSVSFNSGVALINPSGILLNLGLGNVTALNNSYIQTLTAGTLISRNVADANDALTVNLQNTSSTGLILDAQAAGTTVASISKAGLATFSGLNLATVPTTSAGTYDVLTRNTTTGAIEKTSSSIFTAAAANVVYAGPLTGTANPTFRKLQRSDIEEAFGAATTSGVLDWNDITNTQPGFSPTLITGASANGPGGSAYYHPFTMEHSSKTGNGNMTQIGYPYNPNATDGITWRWRYSNTWSAWRKVWDSSNFTNLIQLTTRNFSDLQSKPTTLTGYGITDGATSASVTAVQTSVTTLDNNAVHKAGTETIAGTKFFNGGVGIGLIAATVPSAYKLAVGGGIIAESVKVKPQGEWPDYVFEKGYPMLSLRELETFILKNKHLPNVPSAAEVKKEGIDLGEMDSKLLKKIEELTLYLIEMKKENETLKERLDRLEKK